MSILLGCIALGQGDHRKAAALLEKAAAGAPVGRVRALACFYRGVLFEEKGDYADAIGCFQEAGGHVADPLDSATIHNNIGSCAIRLGDLALAERSFTELEKLADRLGGDAALQCRLAASSHLGAIGLAKGEYPRAMERCRQALKLAQRSGAGEVIANQLGHLGAACAGAGDADAAMQLLDACMACSERLSYWPGIRFACWHIRRIAAENRDNEEARELREAYASRHPELRDLL
jgi:tetratricopeptide (TPR) repeat protein